MLKRFYKKVVVNFRHSRSDRTATNSYGNYNHRIKRIFANVNPFKRISQNSKVKGQK